MSRLEQIWQEIGWKCVPHGLRDCDSCGSDGECEDCLKWEKIAGILDTELTETHLALNLALNQRDDAISLLRQAQTEREVVADQHDAECDRLERDRDEARSIVGRLMFRFAQGCTGDKWRELAEWIPRVEKEARRAWEERQRP